MVHGPETAQGCAHGTIIVRYRNLILISKMQGTSVLRGCASRRSWAAPRAPFPAVVGPGATDEPTDHDERQGQPQPELDHDPAAFGAPAQLAVLVGPGVGALHRPTPARLYGHGL